MLKPSGEPHVSDRTWRRGGILIAAVGSTASTVNFEAMTFVVTGILYFGPDASSSTKSSPAAAAVSGSVSKKTNYLVVVNLGSQDWIRLKLWSKDRACERIEVRLPDALDH